MSKQDIIETVALRKARYCRYLDTKRWDDFAALFSEHPELTFYSPDGDIMAAFTSASDFVALTRDFLAGAQSIHQIYNAEIDVLSDGRASAIWSMEDYILFPAGDAKRPRSMHGYGHYHEIWTRSGNDWVIACMDLRRTILEFQQLDHQA